MLSGRFPIKALLLVLTIALAASAGNAEEYYYAIEQNGVISGYAHVVISPIESNGRPCIQLIDSLWMQMSALGKSFEGRYRFEYHIDPADGMYFYHTSAINQGGTKIGGTMRVRGDSMLITSEDNQDTSLVYLPPGTIRQNTRLFKHFIDFFVRDTLREKEGLIFSEVDGKINPITYFNRGREKLQLGGKTYDALAVESLDRTTGVRFRMWVDAVTGLLLKSLHPFRNVYLSDASVRDKVGRADLNNYLMAPVDKVITDPWAISHMKVQAKLQPGGVWITLSGLNVPGQKFEGSVQDNRIDGVFEISRERYNGRDAPPFRCDFSNVDSLQKYLRPTEMVESGDSSLIRKANEISAGSKDAWEAATRLSKWVHEEIGPDIPGGITALKTYQTRLGECGSHTNLLTAFCRAVGIPARGVFGCMYVPDHGGGFGQHAWNEIYMGSAGWIPIDCTVREITYADCGHIRLGEWVSGSAMFNPEKMEILDYRLASDSTNDKVPSSQTQYDPYIGKYQGERGGLSIVVQNGSLGLLIPGRNMVFELNAPDEGENRFFKLSDASSISFAKDSSETVISMTIQERQKLPRKPGGDSVTAEITAPETYRPIVGSYAVPMQNATLEIVYQDNQLMLRLPGGRSVALTKSEADGQWEDARSQNTKILLSFDRDETGQATAMRLTSLSRCAKITDAATQIQQGKP